MKKNVIINSFIFLCLVSIVICCKKREYENEWYATMSRPAYHPTDGPRVTYFSKGNIIAGTSTLTDISNGGWCYPSETRSVDSKNVFPDSVTVNYGGLNNKLQMCTYEGGYKLPSDKIKKLFEKGYYAYGKKYNFSHIITGLAPGGRICVWLDHVEILRFKAKQLDVYRNYPVIIFQDSTEVTNYLKFHPIDYSVWEHPDPRYALDFGFCSENDKASFLAIYFFSKEGVRNTVFENQIDFTHWNVPFGQKPNYGGYSYQQINNTTVDYKSQFPIEIQVLWSYNSIKYDTRVVIPESIKKMFLKPYVDSETKKKCNYNRIVFGVEKDGLHCNVWLDGLNKQKKVMRFSAEGSVPEKNNGRIQDGGKYSEEIIY